MSFIIEFYIELTDVFLFSFFLWRFWILNNCCIKWYAGKTNLYLNSKNVAVQLNYNACWFYLQKKVRKCSKNCGVVACAQKKA